jgi:hypothetical protein
VSKLESDILILLAQSAKPLTGYDICQALQKNGRIVVDPLLVRAAIVRMGGRRQIRRLDGNQYSSFYGRHYTVNLA